MLQTNSHADNQSPHSFDSINSHENGHMLQDSEYTPLDTLSSPESGKINYKLIIDNVSDNRIVPQTLQNPTFSSSQNTTTTYSENGSTDNQKNSVGADRNILMTLIAKADKIHFDFAADCAPRGDIGAAELFAEIARGLMAFDNAERTWYSYNALYWIADTDCSVKNVVSKTLSFVFAQLAKTSHAKEIDFINSLADPEKPTEDELKKIKYFRLIEGVAKSRMIEIHSVSSVKRAIEFAEAGLCLGVRSDVWDRIPNLIGVKNGVIDLKTGKLVQPRFDQYIRTVAPVAFDENATCPIFLKSLMEIFAGDDSKLNYAKRVLGYAMTGMRTESDFLVWYGKNGRNGKEFFLDRIRNVLGDKLAGPVDSELLMANKNNRSKNSSSEGLMSLRGRRLAFASETNEGRSFDNAAMKSLSGDVTLSGRHNYGRQTEWRATHTLILLTNFKPHVAGGGGGAEWERIRLLEFTESFVSNPDPSDKHQHRKNPDLGAQIDATELSGILNWLLQGAMEWRKSGLQTPVVVLDATKSYRADEDNLGEFVRTACLTKNNLANINSILKQAGQAAVSAKSLFSTVSDLYAGYVAWALASGERSPMGRKAFSRKIEDAGYEKSIVTSGTVFVGIRSFNLTEIGAITNYEKNGIESELYESENSAHG